MRPGVTDLAVAILAWESLKTVSGVNLGNSEFVGLGDML